MEVNANGVLVEELLCPREFNWVNDHFLSNGWNLFHESNLQQQEEEAENPLSIISLQNQPLVSDNFFPPPSSSSYPLSLNQDLAAIYNNINPSAPLTNHPIPLFLSDQHHHLLPPLPICHDHKVLQLPSKPAGRTKKVEGQPSKNLMAERRRRKRLNDRLSMLRSIIPKITKMDRTSILGDTIDYMKELIQRIKTLQEQDDDNDDERSKKLKDVKPNIETSVRNCPKFNVERTSNGVGTKIDMSCATKPGLLLSTVNTLDSLGLDIQHCVISCFADFSLQASCIPDSEERSVMKTSEEIKQTLFRISGYVGKHI